MLVPPHKAAEHVSVHKKAAQQGSVANYKRPLLRTSDASRLSRSFSYSRSSARFKKSCLSKNWPPDRLCEYVAKRMLSVPESKRMHQNENKSLTIYVITGISVTS